MMPSRPCLHSAGAFIQLQFTSAMSLVRKEGSDQSNRLASSGQPHRSPISNVGRTWHFLNTVNLIQQRPQQRCEQPSMDRVAHQRMSYIVRLCIRELLVFCRNLERSRVWPQAHQPLFQRNRRLLPYSFTAALYKKLFAVSIRREAILICRPSSNSSIITSVEASRAQWRR